MGLADELERRLERVVEGLFSKAFRSEIQPAEIGRRLLREMEASRTASMGAVYAPNRYRVLLAPSDYETLAGLIPTLEREFKQTLKENARSRGWKLTGLLTIEFAAAEALSSGRFGVEVTHETTEADGRDTSPATLKLADSSEPKVWQLFGEKMVIGRLDSSDIVLPDLNASRTHAEVVRREERWWIIDLGATNGTLVNGSLIKERPLRSGDRIRIGSTELEYQEEGEPDS